MDIKKIIIVVASAFLVALALFLLISKGKGGKDAEQHGEFTSTTSLSKETTTTTTQEIPDIVTTTVSADLPVGGNPDITIDEKKLIYEGGIPTAEYEEERK